MVLFKNSNKKVVLDGIICICVSDIYVLFYNAVSVLGYATSNEGITEG
jgi:hypothetical protein